MIYTVSALTIAMRLDRSPRLVLFLSALVLAIILVVSYLVDNEGLVTQIIAALFVVVPGYSILRLIDRRGRLDSWETVILSIIIGFICSLTCFLLGWYSLVMSWTASSVLLLLPFSLILLAISSIMAPKVTRSDGPLIMANILKEFRAMPRKDRYAVLFSLVAIAIILSASIYVLANIEEDGFTEFYVLNADGKAYGYPSNVSLGNDTSIIVGIANHEGRAINYTVEIWLVNYTLIDMAVNVTQMYYVQSWSVVLENQDYDLNDPWVRQYEVEVTISPQVAGEFQLYIMLFKDQALAIPEPSPPNGYTDYSKTEASWRIVMCVNKEIDYLNLYLDVLD